jgi:hypothetical protein
MNDVLFPIAVISFGVVPSFLYWKNGTVEEQASFATGSMLYHFLAALACGHYSQEAFKEANALRGISVVHFMFAYRFLQYIRG